MKEDVIVEFPLSGEWFVGADGTEKGHELAFDFVRVDARLRATRTTALRELLTTVPLTDYYGWGQPIHAPFDGHVITAIDGCPEVSRSVASILFDSLVSLFSSGQEALIARMKADGDGDIRCFAGNHLVIESSLRPGVFAFIAHARSGSLTVARGETVSAGQPVAEVGNSGLSTMPHLHFHVMSDPSPLTDRVIPFRFARYEALIDGQWQLREASLPTRRQRIRRVD
ncbi:M23 family metallopeptidase [Paludibacterium paludis]|uniref:M23ase beta-sheet core domain-containing protein n=1 Tax=Paludibacterium paludis TaxID=1225769 RepID=A0A918U9Q3_9NEIS|nr:M23 family metallopeptidase [Paludibacterium paludis]GGY13723.1 hypothetical protein GCM10011289_16330 [Paludibacterium paludis]